MWTPEKITALVTAVTALLIAVGGGVAWLVKKIEKWRKPDADPATPQPVIGMTIEPDDHADDAIEAWRDRAKSAETELSRVRGQLEACQARLYEHPSD
ncbi:hypothetical protein [Auraticoccus monumenti]|uniref:Uncharacterized protein n=1 Tax=Auraticoccus monumenti TaxID=675864 RepID=A0A1G6UIJ6_9ACTN|nr:hypothetical protein [Auraticoccus monumenti]SDD40397.1 hypothetical protein SAMN04489747_0879 [Auraticoccus monumenti]